MDIVHGHSSHHVKAIEVYHERLILYGCGDFLTDYEGIRGNEQFRGDLGLMHFVTMDCRSRMLAELRMVPTRMKGMQIKRASSNDAEWLKETLDLEGRKLGTHVTEPTEGELRHCWD